MTLHLVRKYTGHDITDDSLTAAHQQGGPLGMLATALTHTCHTLNATEAELTRCAETITAHLADIHRVLAAGPDEPAPTLNPTGVLQAHGPRLDTLTAQRATDISHLRALTRIWLAHHAQQPSGENRAEQVRSFADQILAAIDDDISEGIVPAGIGSFVDLHRYLDANDYLIAAGVPYDGTEDSMALITAVQGLVVARLRTPGRPFCTHGACTFAAHDHISTTGSNGEDLEQSAPLRCRQCGQPAHYDSRLKDYRHDDPAVPDCFLIHRDD
ncbi:hypothetical protein [Micromonospora sp. URMC 103]|uniref:hypothetical protein n=1 Tax=Micromonospora sp. URMC 103 TaxID=3423406 RepID=UPI003F1B2F47